MSVKEPQNRGAPRVVVALAASAADTRSLEQLLIDLPVQPHAAIVLALQHREALDEERFGKVLAQADRPLTAIEDGMPLGAGRIYLPAPNAIVTVENGRFSSRPAEQPPGTRGVIDSLLVSLAENEDDCAIVVSFAGTNGDGTLGVKSIKEAGGLALAEETEEVKAGNLAMSHSPAALADTVLSVGGLAERLASHLQRFATAETPPPNDPKAPDTAAALGSIATILRNKTGHDFHGYKPGTFLRRVQRRMQVVQTGDLEGYLEILRTRSDEAQNLFNDLLIGVTSFFRDTREFEILEREVIPRLFEGKGRTDTIRIWVVGCATGEEAYSLAILLRERMSVLDEVPQVQIFATDLDGRALASARVGRYARNIADAMSPERLARWFLREGDTYCIVKELREMCIFSQHSVVKDAPFSRLDLVSCRNLLIYLEPSLQSRVVPLFHFALKSGGFLFLGNSENVSRHSHLFAPVEPRSRVYRRQDTGTRVLPDFPFTAVDRRASEPVTLGDRSPPNEAVLARRAKHFAERYAPAYVIVDAVYNVLHFSGRTGRFLDPAGGAASLNLLQLAHPELRAHLRAALAQAASENRTVHTPGLRVDLGGLRLAVDLVVEPIEDLSGSPSSFFVLFRDGAGLPGGLDDEQVAGSPDEGERTRRLEAELRTTRERLQATVEELESTNEELKSSNEEYQSLNEELQSANEELETSKEELQSVNEELTTVNGELAHRVQELTRATSDLKNFLESTQIATVILDNELRVTSFTPAAAELFHVVESDVGRLIGHIKARIDYEELQDDARHVLRTLRVVEREATNPSTGACYMVRVLPYRSTDNFIAGVVFTFVDITERQKAQEARRQSEERLRAIVENAHDYAIFLTDLKGRIEEWLPGAVTVFGWSPEEAVGKDARILYTPEDRAKGVYEEELSQTLANGVAPNVRWHLRKDGSRVFIEGSARALRDSSGRVRGIIKIGQDVTERRRSDEALRASEAQSKLLLAELQHRVRNTLAVVQSVVRRSAATSETVEEYAMHLEGRITAFARVQAAVTRDPVSGISLGDIVSGELLAHAAREGEQIRRVDGPPILLTAKAAEALALAFHELAVNAVKHGALGADGGSIEVAWKIDGGLNGEPPTLALRWIERGLALSEPPSRRGFGTQLLERTLAYELGATSKLRFEPSGLRFTLSVPLTSRIVVERGEANGGGA